MSTSQVNAKILSLLKVNARATISEIAAKAGVSRTTAKDKIDRMLEKGIIRKFTVDLDDDDAPEGPAKAIFSVRLAKPSCRSIHQSIKSWPELAGFYSLAGEIDLMVIVHAEDAERIDALREELVRLPQVAHVLTTSVLKRWDANG